MPDFSVEVRGRGRVRLPAYGVADAQHRVEKEIVQAWPDARVDVVEIGRVGESRIVEEFAVTYRIAARVDVSAESAQTAAGAAFRRARSLLSGTRYARTEWEELTPPAS